MPTQLEPEQNAHHRPDPAHIAPVRIREHPMTQNPVALPHHDRVAAPSADASPVVAHGPLVRTLDLERNTNGYGDQVSHGFFC